MSDTLRDRIADAIRRAGYQHSYAPGPYLAGIYADAVIDALGLTKEDEYNPYDPFPPPYRVRYVTEWKADDE